MYSGYVDNGFCAWGVMVTVACLRDVCWIACGIEERGCEMMVRGSSMRIMERWMVYGRDT